MLYELDGYVLDDIRLELRCGSRRVPAQPKVLQLLVELVGASGRALSNDELLRAVWPDEHVTVASVKRAIRGARKALGDDGESQRSIRTVRGRGYRLVLPVTPCAADAERGSESRTTDRDGAVRITLEC